MICGRSPQVRENTDLVTVATYTSVSGGERGSSHTSVDMSPKGVIIIVMDLFSHVPSCVCERGIMTSGKGNVIVQHLQTSRAKTAVRGKKKDVPLCFPPPRLPCPRAATQRQVRRRGMCGEGTMVMTLAYFSAYRKDCGARCWR
jgi:hypothetical protein